MDKKVLLEQILKYFKVKDIPEKLGDLRKLYKARFGRPLNLENPKGFNEKLQWLKLYNRNPEYTTMVDK